MKKFESRIGLSQNKHLINFHLHPQILYRTTYVNSIDNQTTLSVSLPRLNYYEKDQNGNNVKHFKDVRLLFLFD